MKKIITVLIMAAILFCLPVSAEEEPVYLPNYGFAYYRSPLVGYRTEGIWFNANVPGSIYFGQQNEVVRSFPGWRWEMSHESNATYHIKMWVDVSAITGTTSDKFFKNDILDFAWTDDTSDLNSVNNCNSDGLSYSSLISSTLTFDGNSVIYDIYYSTAPGYLDNIPLALVYYYIAFDCAVHASTNYYVTSTHVQVEAWQDVEGEIYEDILAQIAANQEVIIDNQEAMINVGSDYISSIPNNDTQLESAVGSIDSAEDAILSATDPTGTAMSDFSSQAQLTMSEINTSYNSTFAYINGLVDRVFDLGMGTVVFLSLTMGLVAYIFGRIR